MICINQLYTHTYVTYMYYPIKFKHQRTNRRILTNEEYLIKRIEKETGAKVTYVEFGKSEKDTAEIGDDVNDTETDDGYHQGDSEHLISNKSTYVDDIMKIQKFRLLLGGQGSGLINGLYLRPSSSTMVLYQYQGWDVFHPYLKPIGGLYSWYNRDVSKSFCDQEIDPYCDSPDTEVNIEQVVEMVKLALKDSRSHCK
jgi:hypothetical protein